MDTNKEYIKMLDQFYSIYQKKDMNKVGCMLVVGIFLFCQVVFMALPYELAKKEGLDAQMLVTLILISVMPVTFYLSQFTTCMETGVKSFMYKKLKYLPVSEKMWRSYLFEKMGKFILKTVMGCGVLQIGISLIAFGGILPGTVIYLLVYTVVIPVIAGGTVVFLSTCG